MLQNRSTHLAAIAVVAVAALAACVQVKAPRTAARGAPAGVTCDTIVGKATSLDRATASQRADMNFRNQAPDFRGDMVRAGLRDVRVLARYRACESYRLAGAPTGLITCTSSARICGR